MTLKEIKNQYKNFNFEADQIENSKCPSWTKCCKQIKAALQPICDKNGWTIENFSPNWYSCSFFVTTNNLMGKCQTAYVSLSDPRTWKNWYDDILIRSAESAEDYKGGTNCHCKLEELEQAIKNIHEKGYHSGGICL